MRAGPDRQKSLSACRSCAKFGGSATHRFALSYCGRRGSSSLCGRLRRQFVRNTPHHNLGRARVNCLRNVARNLVRQCRWDKCALILGIWLSVVDRPPRASRCVDFIVETLQLLCVDADRLPELLLNDLTVPRFPQHAQCVHHDVVREHRHGVFFPVVLDAVRCVNRLILSCVSSTRIAGGRTRPARIAGGRTRPASIAGGRTRLGR